MIKLLPFLQSLAIDQADGVTVEGQVPHRGHHDVLGIREAPQASIDHGRSVAAVDAVGHHHQHIQVTIRPHLPTGSGPKENDADRMDGLKDAKAYARIEVRAFRLGLGLPGDVKAVGKGVSELRIDHGPGYRVYFCKKGKTLSLLLVGGDKTTQIKDIQTAQRLASKL